MQTGSCDTRTGDLVFIFAAFGFFSYSYLDLVYWIRCFKQQYRVMTVRLIRSLVFLYFVSELLNLT